MITVGNVVNVPDNVRAALQQEVEDRYPEAGGEYRVISLEQRLAGGREAIVYLPRLKTLIVFRVFYLDSRTAVKDCVASPLIVFPLDAPPVDHKGFIETGHYYDMGDLAPDLQSFADAEGQAGRPLHMLYLQPTPVGAQALIYVQHNSGGLVYVVGMAQVRGGYRCSSLAHAIIEFEPEAADQPV